jgi:hypothetical protein
VDDSQNGEADGLNDAFVAYWLSLYRPSTSPSFTSLLSILAGNTEPIEFVVPHKGWIMGDAHSESCDYACTSGHIFISLINSSHDLSAFSQSMLIPHTKTLQLVPSHSSPLQARCCSCIPLRFSERNIKMKVGPRVSSRTPLLR